MSEGKHNVLFPVETINRELDFRLFLAVMFSHPSRRIYIGYMHRLNRLIKKLHGGLYVGKHIFYREPNPLRFYRPLKENGFSMVMLHEEGGIFTGPQEHWDQQLADHFNHDWLQSTDYICTWGEWQANHYRENARQLAQHVRVTGHPRFDLYGPRYRQYYEDEIQELKNKYGKYILVNTNLGTPNHSKGYIGTFKRSAGYLPEDDEKRMYFLRRWANDLNILGGMVCLVHRLSIQYPHKNIVVRPHPSEKIEFYKHAFAGINNIKIEHSGPVGPWVMAAEMLIHDGCTTAIEAFFSGTPVINYKSVEHKLYDILIPNALGLRCKSEDEVIEGLDRFFRTGSLVSDVSKLNPLVYEAMNNFKSEAFAPLLAVMDEALAQVGKPMSNDSMLTVRRREFWAQSRDWLRDSLRPFSRRRELHMAERQKFYGFKASSIARKLEKVQRILGKSVQYKLLSEQMLVIDSE